MQPTSNCPALQRDGQLADDEDAQVFISPQVCGHHSFEQSVLFRRNLCCAPKTLSDAATKFFFDQRNDAVTNAVSGRFERTVTGVFAKLEPMHLNVVVDLFSPDPEERTHDRELYPTDLLNRDRLHRSPSFAAAPAEQIKQERFHAIIRVMAEKNRRAAPVTTDLCEEFQSRLAPRFLKGAFVPDGARFDVLAFRFEWQPGSRSNPFDKARVSAAGAAPQAMIEVAD